MERRRSKRKKMTSAAPSRLVELTLVAYYPTPWKSDAEEVTALDQDRWHPTSKDFYAVAHTPNQGRHNATIVREVNNIRSLVGAIKFEDLHGRRERPNGSIGRLNLISHGGKRGVFGLSGEVRANGNVFCGRGLEDHFLDEVIDEHTLKWFNNEGRGHRDDIRAKLDRGAEFWLFLCSAASVGPCRVLSEKLANTFNVTVRAYNDEVWYYPDHKNAKNQIKCSGDDVACFMGRNLTSIGQDDADKDSKEDDQLEDRKKQGRGYFCHVKVPDAFAGTHMRHAVVISPKNIHEDEEGEEGGEDER